MLITRNCFSFKHLKCEQINSKYIFRATSKRFLFKKSPKYEFPLGEDKIENNSKGCKDDEIKTNTTIVDNFVFKKQAENIKSHKNRILEEENKRNKLDPYTDLNQNQNLNLNLNADSVSFSDIVENIEEERDAKDIKEIEEEEEEEIEEEIEEEEEIEDNIDTLLYTNNLNSSFIGELWHTSANSYFKNKYAEKIKTDNNKNKEEIELNESENIKKKLKADSDKVHNFVKEIYEEEKREAEELQEYFEKNEKKLTNFRNSIFCRLKLAKELSEKYDHASKTTKVVTLQEANKKKEEHYKKIIDSLNNISNEGSKTKQNKKQKKCYNYDNVEIIKILDIDSLPTNVLNNLFAYKLVKNCSAEICLKVITRLGMYRDKYTQISYENMITDIGKIINNEKNAEIIALFCRCYETISIPFLINFVRKYGCFSRSFLVDIYEKFFKKRLFDFVRYQNNMGIRKIPNILTHPYYLSSYVKLLGECSAKKDMYIQLKMKGFIPVVNTVNYQLENNFEDHLLPRSSTEHKKIKTTKFIEEKTKEKRRKNFVERPLMYDVILSAEYSGIPVENFIEGEDDKSKHTLLDSVKTENQHKFIQDNQDIDESVTFLERIQRCNKGTEGTKEKEETITEIKETRNEIKEETRNEIKEETRNEIKEETRNEIKEETRNEIKEETRNEIKEETRNEIKEETKKVKEENVNFTMEEECDVYLYQKFNRLNSASFILQTKLAKVDEQDEKSKLIEYRGDNDFDKIEEIEKYEDSLWDLPWKTKKRNSFFYKGRFFKIIPEKGWKEIEEVSKQHIKPKRKRQKHSVRRKRILERKIKINLLKKKILEKEKKKKELVK